MGRVEERWPSEESQRTLPLPTPPSSGHQARVSQQLGPEEGREKEVLFSCPGSSLTKWILPTPPFYFFLFLTLFCKRYRVDVGAPGLLLLSEDCPSSWMLFVSTHVLHSHLRWSKTTLQFLLCTPQGFTGHGQSVLLIRSREKAPKTFTVSKTISFLWEWQVCSYSIPPHKWEPYDHEARESAASLRCSLSTKHLSNLCMGKASSANVRPVHGLGYCQNRCGPFCRSQHSCQISLLFCPFFPPPGFCILRIYFLSQPFLKVYFPLCGILPVLVPNED